ncbi:phosphopantothenate--cysteine ligase-like isoform X2 [Ptychodera flava]|uniref:phosphopantothenate--cysteine ligase-like isoform X2 n=1 Tax=Ptychodera flava TaxID=63121 RepID=UPI00396A75B1
MADKQTTAEAAVEEWESFYKNSTPPKDYSKLVDKMKDFAVHIGSFDQKLVLVTSGGTSVPLESRTVRYLDNFSIGTRGAASAEYFLQCGYFVIFLHRHRSLQPYNRHLLSCNLLESLKFDQENNITVDKRISTELEPVLRNYQKFKDRLCLIEFTSLADYLHLLQAAAQVLNDFGRHAMLYLAAAVSDFYIPASLMVEHKIQSSEGALQLTMELVPKMLKPLVMHWAKNAYIISFKLETDESNLLPKARKALETYQHQRSDIITLNNGHHHHTLWTWTKVIIYTSVSKFSACLFDDTRM